MIETFEKAKAQKEILHFKNFQEPEITWEDAVKFIYSDSSFETNKIDPNSWGASGRIYGNVLTIGGYILPHTKNLFPVFKGVSELMEKVNGNKRSQNCAYYNDPTKTDNLYCDCGSMWHIQALRFCISQHHVPDHNDPNDVLYWQVLGTSYWKMNKDKVYTLNPGDLLYFNQEDSHEVWQDGPRAGIIIDGPKR